VKKYLDHEKKKLKEKNKKIDLKWQNESKKFNETHKESIEKNKMYIIYILIIKLIKLIN